MCPTVFMCHTIALHRKTVLLPHKVAYKNVYKLRLSSSGRASNQTLLKDMKTMSGDLGDGGKVKQCLTLKPTTTADHRS